MYLKSIEISGIRNISESKCDLAEGVSFIVGNNGQGKTSFIESIFLLSHARSFRTSSIKDVASQKTKKNKSTSDFSYIAGIVSTDLGELELSISIEKGKRNLCVNQKRVSSASEFCGVLKTVLFTPEDLEIVKGGPVIRRQFLDRMIIMLDRTYLQLLLEYSKLIKTRNILLQQQEFKKARIFDPQLIDKNFLILMKRREFVNGIKDQVASIYTSIAENTGEQIEVQYRSSFLKKGDLLSKEEAMEKLDSSFEFDKRRGRTNIGVHRDEIVLEFKSEYGAGLSKIISSQGQVRTIALCCKLASAHYIYKCTNDYPLLLLDDVDSELDDTRRASLYECISNYKGQIFITGTRYPEGIIDNLQEKKISKYFIKEGSFVLS